MKREKVIIFNRLWENGLGIAGYVYKEEVGMRTFMINKYL